MLQDRCLNDLIKNFDKHQDPLVVSSCAPPEHLDDLLSSLQRHLLAYCYANSSEESLVSRITLLLRRLFKFIFTTFCHLVDVAREFQLEWKAMARHIYLFKNLKINLGISSHLCI